MICFECRAKPKRLHEAFRYQAQQGIFEPVIAKKKIEIIETDTTIELLSCYIFKHLYRLARCASLRVVTTKVLTRVQSQLETAHLE